MDKETLFAIKARLEALSTQWYIASRWKDKRSRHKKMHDAALAISTYADTLPPEVLGLFDTKVAPAALNTQFAGDDINKCIEVLEEQIRNNQSLCMINLMEEETYG